MSSDKSSPNTSASEKIEALLLGLFLVVGGVFRTAFAFSFTTSKLLGARKASRSRDEPHNAGEGPVYAPPITFFFLTLVAALLLIGAYVRPIQRAYEILQKNPASKPSPDRVGAVTLEEQFSALTALLPSRDRVEAVSAAASKMSLGDLAVSMLPYIGCLALLAGCLFFVLWLVRRQMPYAESLEVSAYFAGTIFFWGSISVCLYLPWQSDLMAKIASWSQTLPTDPNADATPYMEALKSIFHSIAMWKRAVAIAGMVLAVCVPIMALWGLIRVLWLHAASFVVAVIATFLSVGLFCLSFWVLEPMVSPIMDSLRVSETTDWFRLREEK